MFVKFFGSQNCLPDEKMALKKALPDGNLAFKYHYRTGIWLSKIITGQFLSGKIYMHFSIFYSEFSDFSPMTP